MILLARCIALFVILVAGLALNAAHNSGSGAMAPTQPVTAIVVPR